jgi:hypothetical protein
MAFFGIFIIPVIVISTALYFLPTIITLARHKKQTLAIVLLNIFAGWTGIGWIAALIWAVVKESGDK